MEDIPLTEDTIPDGRHDNHIPAAGYHDNHIPASTDTKTKDTINRGKRSFRLFKSKKSSLLKSPNTSLLKSPNTSLLNTREQDKSSDRLSTKSSDKLSVKSSDKLSIKSKDKSPKFRAASLRKLFKRPKSACEELTPDARASYTSSDVSFSNIMCSTPLINTTTDSTTDSTCYYSNSTCDDSNATQSSLNSDNISFNSEQTSVDHGRPSLEQPALTSDKKPDSLYLEHVNTRAGCCGNKTDPDRSDESGIFSPSFLLEPFSPPSAFKSEPTRSKNDCNSNTSSSHGNTNSSQGNGVNPVPKLDRECSYEKLFNKFKIPTIEFTMATNSTKSIGDKSTAEKAAPTKHEEFVSSPLARNTSGKAKNSAKTEPYHVELTVISSSNLAARDSNGLSDPYCKVKVGLQRARTKVCPKNLNPLWEEKFSFVVESLDDTVRLKVMDYDRGFRDDLIGYYEMKLSLFPLDDYQTFTEELQDENGTESLGTIKFMIHISADFVNTPPPDVYGASICSSPPSTPPEVKKLVRKPTTYDTIVNKFLGAEKMDDRETQRSTSPFQEKHLSGVLSITLLEACNLRPMNKDGSSDPYCKFKLGYRKHKSKVMRRTLDPVWKERFEIRVYSDSSSILEISVYDHEEFGFSDNFIGSAEVDISEFEESKTYKREVDLEKDGGRIICLFNLSNITDSATESGCELSPDDFVRLRKTYAMSYNPLNYLTYKWEDVEDVGVLIVKIIKCIDLPEAETIIGTSDPFCFIEVENTRVRTPTLYKTQDPVWNKQFKFNIKDIHSTLNIRVFDEEKNKYNFLGCVKLPIIEAQVVHRCLLKDRKLERVGFGEIFLETELIYNPLRAAIKTLLPTEENLMYEEPKFKRNLFMQNFKRVYALATVALSLGLWIQRIYNWENKAKSTIALLLYVLLVVTFELYMVPMFAAIVIIYEFLARWVGFKTFETWVLNADQQDQANKEEDPEDGEDFSLTAKMKMVMGVCQTVQNSLDLVASYCERVKNVFNWTIPFLSFMAATALISGTILLYFIPLRWLVLCWGINKLTVKLRNPEYEENQEVLNFLSRLPSDVELNQMRIITKEASKRKDRHGHVQKYRKNK